VLLAGTGALIAGALVTGFFLVHDGGRRVWESTVLFNSHYVWSRNFGWAGFWVNLKSFWLAWPALFFFTGAALLRPAGAFCFWIGLFGIAWLCTSASVYGHYYIPLMLFWAVVAARGIQTTGEFLAGWLKRSSAGIVGLIGVLTMAACLLPDLRWIACPPSRFLTTRLGVANPFYEAPLVARRVEALSTPDDPVFVAGSEPQLLLYADRFSPTRFITMYPLMIPTPVARQYQQELMKGLEQRPPALIVLVRSNYSWLLQTDSPPDFGAFLSVLLNHSYTPVGGFVLDQTSAVGFWAEPLADEQFGRASLVLFKRKPAGP
jgi:hypothetical protein